MPCPNRQHAHNLAEQHHHQRTGKRGNRDDGKSVQQGKNRCSNRKIADVSNKIHHRRKEYADKRQKTVINKRGCEKQSC